MTAPGDTPARAEESAAEPVLALSGKPFSAAELDAGVDAANVPTLLMALVHLTGDRRWLASRYRPERPRGLGDDDTGGLSEGIQDEIRAAAREVLASYLAAGAPPISELPAEDLVQMMSFFVGEDVPAEYGPMMASDLAAQVGRPPAVSGPPAPDGLNAVIVGAGPCGLLAAIRFQEAGIPYTLIERNSDVAGTWGVNGYPGAAVDTPNHIYSFSFAPHDWSRYFAGRDELREYLIKLADAYGIRERALLRTEARSATWDDSARMWRVSIRRRDGSDDVVSARLLISAVGAFNIPRIPAIPGLDQFTGPSFHTARWPQGLDLHGLRVGVIGTGASAMQVVPAIADDAETVTVFQRSPQWAAPFEKFKVEVPAPLRRLMAEVPVYRAWYRLRQGWIFNDKVYDSLVKDPQWEHPDRSLNAVNDGYRRFFTRYIQQEIGSHSELADKVIPSYPPFGKRMLLDNRWFKTITRDDVQLETGRIRAVGADRIVMESGAEHLVDVLVLATGFDAVHFLTSLEVRGRSGQPLAEAWQGDDAGAYLGMAVPDYPNLFILNGPNTLTGHGGSLLFLAECEVHYVMDLVSQMIKDGLAAVDCRPEVYQRYIGDVNAQHERMVWTHRGMSTYYRNSKGRVVVNSPWRVVDFWAMTRHANLPDYIVEKDGSEQDAG
jgi:4-hydroxyacetophenone monooxygenase